MAVRRKCKWRVGWSSGLRFEVLAFYVGSLWPTYPYNKSRQFVGSTLSVTCCRRNGEMMASEGP